MSEPRAWEKPWTKAERSELALHATLSIDGKQHREACMCLRYENTLQGKDVQIERLEDALRSIVAIEPADPRRNKFEIVQAIAKFAFEEVMDGN